MAGLSRLFVEGLLICKQRQFHLLVYSTCILLIIITQIIYGIQGQNSRLPTPSFWSQSICRGREELGGVYPPSQLERTLQLSLYVMVDIVNEDGRASLTLTSKG
jgi:hypothetical protein